MSYNNIPYSSQRERVYVCFHCKQSLVGDDAAEAHFGRLPTENPQCWMYPKDMKQIIRQKEALRGFAVNLFNGMDAGAIRFETDADETLANVLAQGREALSRT